MVSGCAVIQELTASSNRTWLIGLVLTVIDAPYFTMDGIHFAVGQSPAWHSHELLGSPPLLGSRPKMRFEPSTVNLTPGQTVTLGIVVENVTDLYSVPMLLQYNPAIISVEEVRHGGFLSGGTQEIAIVQRVDKEHGQAIISATRQPNTPGVNGSGTLMGIVIKGLAAGTSNLSIVQVNAKDSQQKPIPLVTSEATLQVQP